MTNPILNRMFFLTFAAAIPAFGLVSAYGQSYPGSGGQQVSGYGGESYSGYGGQQVILSSPQNTGVEQLPSYPYDPNLDPKNFSSLPATNYQRVEMDLATRSGIDLGAQTSFYRYQDPGIRLTGPKFGLNALLTESMQQNWFFTADLRGAIGYSDYRGTGSKSDNFEDLWDLRALVGKDFIISNNFSMSPFVGVGFRDLYSDERGSNNSGYAGFRRQNLLYYLPLGVEPRFRMTPDARFAVNVEYDQVLWGKQLTTLSDVDPSFPNFTNSQRYGYGLRGSIMWEQQKWAFGPFASYWRIHLSDTVCNDSGCGLEPANHTIEAGLQAHYHF